MEDHKKSLSMQVNSQLYNSQGKEILTVNTVSSQLANCPFSPYCSPRNTGIQTLVECNFKPRVEANRITVLTLTGRMHTEIHVFDKMMRREKSGQ